MRRLVFSPLATLEIESATTWYNDRHPGLGDEFQAELKEVFAKIVKHPELYRVIARNRGFRKVLCSKFPYRVIFAATDEEIMIIRVIHGARSQKGY